MSGCIHAKFFNKNQPLIYQITIIGEATKRLSQPFRQQHSEIRWREIAGMRDVIVYKDDRVDIVSIFVQFFLKTLYQFVR